MDDTDDREEAIEEVIEATRDEITATREAQVEAIRRVDAALDEMKRLDKVRSEDDKRRRGDDTRRVKDDDRRNADDERRNRDDDRRNEAE